MFQKIFIGAPGALAALNAKFKAKINATNAKYGVHWKMSYANAEQTKTFCLCEAPSEKAVRDAAAANHIPVDTHGSAGDAVAEVVARSMAQVRWFRSAPDPTKHDPDHIR